MRAMFIYCLSFILMGCESTLPRQTDEIRSKWSSFDDAKSSFDRIEPEQTTTSELAKLGFDPYLYPNIKILTYLNIIDKFVPNQTIRIADLDEGIQKCINARKRCYALQVDPSYKRAERVGNAALDIMNFKESVEIKGWEFNAIVVIIDEKVVYKIWGGTPSFDIRKDNERPWGPVEVLKETLGG